MNCRNRPGSLANWLNAGNPQLLEKGIDDARRVQGTELGPEIIERSHAAKLGEQALGCDAFNRHRQGCGLNRHEDVEIDVYPVQTPGTRPIPGHFHPLRCRNDLFVRSSCLKRFEDWEFEFLPPHGCEGQCGQVYLHILRGVGQVKQGREAKLVGQPIAHKGVLREQKDLAVGESTHSSTPLAISLELAKRITTLTRIVCNLPREIFCSF